MTPAKAFTRNIRANHPIILGLFSGTGGRFTLYRPGMPPLEAPSVPLAYQLLKSVGHSTLAVSEVVLPYVDNPADQSWRGSMLAYRARLKFALDGIDAMPIQADWRENNRLILQNNIAVLRRLPCQGRHHARRGTEDGDLAGPAAAQEHRVGRRDPRLRTGWACSPSGRR